MKSKKVTALEPIRAFYTGNELLGDVFKIPEKFLKKRLEPTIKKIVGRSNKLSAKELLNYNLGNQLPRYDNYLNSTWELKEIDIKDCGIWPCMGGLPDVATRGSVLETVAYIQPFLKDKNKLTFKTARILYIEEMMKYAEKIPP